MLAKTLALTDQLLDKLLELTEHRLKKIRPRFPWGYLSGTAIVALLLFAFLLLFVCLEQVAHALFYLGRSATLDAVLEHVSERISFWCLATLVITLFLFLLRIFVLYRREKLRLIAAESSAVRAVVRDLHTHLDSLEVDAAGRALQLIQSGLEECAKTNPLKALFDSSQPGHATILTRLDQLGDETRRSIGMFRRLVSLKPASAKDALERFLEASEGALNRDWGPLYFTFAIRLQLEPWTESPDARRYTFVRDYEEVACFGTAGDADARFHARFEQDLDVILDLVNGQLWSVMYRDTRFWRQPSYWESNWCLRERRPAGSSDLQRLFLYDTDWLSDVDKVLPLIFGAVWHELDGYPCRFVECPKDAKSIIIAADDRFIASCVVNETRIQMRYHETGSKTDRVKRYIFECSAEEHAVKSYRDEFRFFYDTRGDDATGFLKNVAGAHGGTIDQARRAIEAASASRNVGV